MIYIFQKDINFLCFSAWRAAGGGRQALQLEHSGGLLEAALRWQAERGHQGIPDLYPAQKLGKILLLLHKSGNHQIGSFSCCQCYIKHKGREMA